MSPDGAAHSTGEIPQIRRTTWDRIISRVFSFPAFLAVALITLAVLTVRSRFNDPDLWWHLKNGQTIWTTGQIPRADLYSYTAAGHPWTSMEWLSDILIYNMYRAGGYSGLMLLLCALTATFCVLHYLVGWVASGNPKIALLGGLSGWLFGTVGFAVRPQLIGSIFLLTELALIHLARRHDRRWLWALPPLFSLWVNCHPSQVIGIVAFASYWLCSMPRFRIGSLVSNGMDRSESRMFGVALALSIAMLFVNPIGWRLPFYPFNAVFYQPYTAAIVTEWWPLDMADARSLAMFGVAALIFGLVLLRHTELHLTDLAWLAIGMGSAIKHRRMVVIFGILVTPVLCRLLADLWENYRPERDSRLGNILAMSAAIAVIVWAIPDRQNIRQQIAAENPVKAVEFIRKSHIAGPMMNDFIWGGYLMWAFPEEKVFIDGRADIFEWAGVLADYGKWYKFDEDPRRVLDKYHVNFCLLPFSTPMSNVLGIVPGWREAYRDDLAVVFTRVPAP
jgi:hypothetical protein